MSQLHKRFTSDQVKELLERYSKNEIERKYIQEILGIKRRRFFVLLKEYKENPQLFTIQYNKTTPSRSISADIEQNILKELATDKKIIRDKEIPLKCYNYSYIQKRLRKTYRQKVSLNTIIHRAKKHGFYLKKPKKKPHDREVLTHYAGELIHMTPLIISGHPPPKRNGISSPPWMIIAVSYFMQLWSEQKPPGPISWLFKPLSFAMDSLTPTMWTLIPSSDLSKGETPIGESTTS
jgi:hypothetical protein